MRWTPTGAFVSLLGPDGKVGDPSVLRDSRQRFSRADRIIEGRYLGQTNEQILRLHIAAIDA